MSENHPEQALDTAIRNDGAPGDENDARNANPSPALDETFETSLPADNAPAPKPYDDASTYGRSDAPKRPLDGSQPQVAPPNPTEVGEAG